MYTQKFFGFEYQTHNKRNHGVIEISEYIEPFNDLRLTAFVKNTIWTNSRYPQNCQILWQTIFL